MEELVLVVDVTLHEIDCPSDLIEVHLVATFRRLRRHGRLQRCRASTIDRNGVADQRADQGAD